MSEKAASDSKAIRAFEAADRQALIALWNACGLVKPWNDPNQDIDLFLAKDNAEIFVKGTWETLSGSVAVGHDGHRGWIYYLSVDLAQRKTGLGEALMRRAEEWLQAQGLAKMQLMVRAENLGVKRFYAAIGYEPNTCHLMQRWLDGREAPGVKRDRDDGKLEVTITYLEMTEPPHLAAVHPPQGEKLALLHAEPPTVDFYRYLYDTVGRPWLWYDRRTLGDEVLKKIIEDEAVEVYVLYVNGVPAGFAELDRRQQPEIELAYFGLMPSFIGKGYGRYFLTWVIERAWSYEPERLWVHSCDLDHPKALATYQQCGFAPYDQEKRLIDDPRLSGIIPG